MTQSKEAKQETARLEWEVIKLWKQTKKVHPSYQEIAAKVGCSRQNVFRIIHKYIIKAGHNNEN